MTKELQKALQTLRDMSPKLNEATDRANELVAAVEAFLNKECSIGIGARVLFRETKRQELDPNDDERTQTVEVEEWLVYERIGPGYHIGIALTELVGGLAESYRADIGVLPWSQEDRDTKLASFAVLPDLLQTIAENVGAVVDKTDGVIDVVAKLTDALGK